LAGVPHHGVLGIEDGGVFAARGAAQHSQPVVHTSLCTRVWPSGCEERRQIVLCIEGPLSTRPQALVG